MFENIIKFFKKVTKKEKETQTTSKDTAKERLHLVLMQDRANVSADFLELMKQEIIEVIKKYIEVDEGAIDVRLTNKENEDGTNGAPALYANIPILNIKNEIKKEQTGENKKEEIKEENKTENKIEIKTEDKTENKIENKTEAKNEIQNEEPKIKKKAQKQEEKEEIIDNGNKKEEQEDNTKIKKSVNQNA